MHRSGNPADKIDAVFRLVKDRVAGGCPVPSIHVDLVRHSDGVAGMVTRIEVPMRLIDWINLVLLLVWLLLPVVVWCLGW